MRKLALVMAMAVALTSVNVGNFNPMNCVQTVSAEETSQEIKNQLFGKKIENNNVQYQLKDGILTVSGTGVADNSYRNGIVTNDIKKIVIKSGITAIGDEAFMGLKNVKEITIPNTVTILGFRCLKGLAMDEITIPKSVKIIGSDAIKSSIKKITMPGNFQYVNDDWYYEGGFIELDAEDEGECNPAIFPMDGVIPKKCSVYLNTEFNPGVRETFAYAKRVYTYKKDKKYKNYGKYIYTKNEKKMVFVLSSVKNLKVRKGCKIVYTSAFCYMPSEEHNDIICHLKSIIIPDGVKYIVDYFPGTPEFFEKDKCKIIVKTKKLSATNFVFLRTIDRKDEFIKKKYGVRTKKGMKISYDNVLLKYTGKSKKLTIPKEVKRIEPSAFCSAKNLTSITIQGKLKKIDNAAFYNASKLKKVKLPDSVETIGSSAFENTALTKINWPKKLKKIENDAFSNTKFKTIAFPKNLTIIGCGAFQMCGNLSSIKCNKKLKTIEAYAFNNCKRLKEVTLNKNLKLIETEAFGEIGAKKIVLPKNTETEERWYYKADE